MSFNAKQRAVLRSVRDRKWRVFNSGVRVWGKRNNGERAQVCPVCAAAIKVRPMQWRLDAGCAVEKAGLDLSYEDVRGLIAAADNPGDPNSAELLALLGVGL